MNNYFHYTYSFLKKYRNAFLKSLYYVLLLTALQVLLPVSLRWFVKEVEAKQTLPFLCLGLIAYGVYLLITNLADVGWAMSLNILGGKIMQGIREDLLKTISKADYESLLNIGKDKLKNILFMDTLNVFRSVAHLGIQIVSNCILLIVFLIVSAYLNPKLTIILFIASIIGFLISFFSRKAITSSSRKVNDELKANNQMLNEYIDALELVKTNNLDNYFLNKNETSLWRFINTSIRVDKKQIFLKNLINNFHHLVSIGIVAFLSMTAHGDSAGNLIFYLFVSDMVLQNSQDIESSIYSLLKIMPSFEHINMILNLNLCDGKNKVGPIKSIEFNNVNFSYKTNSDKLVVKNISNKFESGDVVRVLGINGGGKSTFVKLLVGLLHPTSGSILINNVSHCKVDPECLKNEIVYIDQDEVILNDNIKNYAEIMAGHAITDTQLDELMSLVKLDNQIEMVSENGHSISGGQRKKLLMMKLFLKYKVASVIILDEIEAGVDAETKEIISMLENEIISNKKDCIIFKITHETTESNFYTKTIEFNGSNE